MEYVKNYNIIIEEDKQIIKTSVMPLYVEGRDGTISIEEEYSNVKEIVLSGQDTTDNQKAIEYKDLLEKFSVPYLQATVEVFDTNANITVRGRDNVIAYAEEQAGIEYRREFVWIDGAETSNGRIILPYHYDRVFVAKGSYDNPKIIFIDEGVEGDTMPYYYKEDGKTIIMMEGFSGGGGTQLEPYKVETLADLNNIRNNLSAHYIQTKHIDASDTINWVHANGTGFAPIGIDNVTPFSGSYDGDDYEITNLYIRNSTMYTALFGYAVASRGFKNVRLINCDIGSTMVDGRASGLLGGGGGVVTGSYTTTNMEIDSCVVTGKIANYATSTASIVSGLASWFSNGSVSRCRVDVDLTGAKVGGLLYSGGGVVRYCEVHGRITPQSTYAELCGMVHQLGGITFIDSYTDIVIQNPNNLGQVKASAWGYHISQNAKAGYSFSNARIEGVYVNKIAYNYSANYPTSGNLRHDFYINSTTTGTSDSTSGRTQVQMNDPSTFSSFNFTNAWEWKDNTPILRKRGSKKRPFLITNVYELQAVDYDLGSYYVLLNDIDATETNTWNNGEGFIPLGERRRTAFNTSSPTSVLDYRLSGFFDGKGFSIKNLYVNKPHPVVALFSQILPIGLVKDLTLENPYLDGSMKGTTRAGQTAGFAGNILGEYKKEATNGYFTFLSSKIINCHVKGGIIKGDVTVAGLVGTATATNLINCSVDCQIENTGTSGNQVGAMVGYAYHSQFLGCSTKGSIANTNSGPAANRVSGFIGLSYGTHLYNCYVRAEVRQPRSGTGYVAAAFFGEIGNYSGYSPTVSDRLYIHNCYHASTLYMNYGTTSPMIVNTLASGVLTALIYRDVYQDKTLVNNLDVTSTGRYGKTTAEMKLQSTFVNWDFSLIWYMPENDYPELYYKNPNETKKSYLEYASPDWTLYPTEKVAIIAYVDYGPPDTSQPYFLYPLSIATLNFLIETGKIEASIVSITDPYLKHNFLRIMTNRGVGAIDIIPISELDGTETEVRVLTHKGIFALRKKMN